MVCVSEPTRTPGTNLNLWSDIPHCLTVSQYLTPLVVIVVEVGQVRQLQPHLAPHLLPVLLQGLHLEDPPVVEVTDLAVRGHWSPVRVVEVCRTGGEVTDKLSPAHLAPLLPPAQLGTQPPPGPGGRPLHLVPVGTDQPVQGVSHHGQQEALLQSLSQLRG